MKEYILRKLSPSILEASRSFPVIVLTGPRQTGKSTLLQKIFPDHTYLTFDDMMLRSGAKSDPAFFVEKLQLPIILDEIQYVPELLSYIKIIVDKNRQKNGLFIIAGSQIFPLMAGLAESLAGRVAIFELPGISMEELPVSDSQRHSLFNRILKGGFPDVLIHKVDGKYFFPSYVQTYLERDIRLIQNVGDLTLFQNFLRLLALRIGNILNITSIANDLGIAVTTCKRWLSLLENSGIIYLLRPWFRNIGKRLIKSPKLFFTDTGLASYLLRINSTPLMDNSDYNGALFENFIIMELLKLKQNFSSDFDIWYYRDTNGSELDFLLETSEGLIGGEIKLSMTPSKSHIKNLRKEFLNLNLKKGILVSSYEKEIPLESGISNLPWDRIITLLD